MRRSWVQSPHPAPHVVGGPPLISLLCMGHRGDSAQNLRDVLRHVAPSHYRVGIPTPYGGLLT